MYSECLISGPSEKMICYSSDENTSHESNNYIFKGTVNMCKLVMVLELLGSSHLINLVY